MSYYDGSLLKGGAYLTKRFLVAAPHSAPVPNEPLIIYMINTMSNEEMIDSDDQSDNPSAFFQAISSSKDINTIMKQAVYNADTKPAPAWQLAILKRNLMLVKLFIDAGLRIGQLEGGMDIFRNFVYGNDRAMTQVLLEDPSIVQELNRKR